MERQQVRNLSSAASATAFSFPTFYSGAFSKSFAGFFAAGCAGFFCSFSAGSFDAAAVAPPVVHFLRFLLALLLLVRQLLEAVRGHR